VDVPKRVGFCEYEISIVERDGKAAAVVVGFSLAIQIESRRGRVPILVHASAFDDVWCSSLDYSHKTIHDAWFAARHNLNRRSAWFTCVCALIAECILMRFKKLRIAWSVAWGVVAVLLVVLWVRSYRLHEIGSWQVSKNRSVGVTSVLGRVLITSWNQPESAGSWRVHSEQVRSEHDRLLLPENAIGFGIIRFQANAEVHIPYWLLVLLTATISASPWFRLAKRFSLRALLIATTLVAVVLGLVMWAGRR